MKGNETSDVGRSDEQLERRIPKLPLSRRGALAGVLGLGGLSLLGSDGSRASEGGVSLQVGPPARPWRSDQNANGHALLNLGALAMADNPTAITDFVGTNLSIDGGILAATDTRTDVSDGDGLVVGETSDITFAASGAASVAVTDDGDGTATVEVGAIDTDTDTHTGVSEGGTMVLPSVENINFASGLSVGDDGDGTVTVDASGVSPWADGDSDGLLEVSGFDGIDVDAVDTNRIGTTTNDPLDVVVNDERGFRIEPSPPFSGPNVVGGDRINSVSSGVGGATIGGGGWETDRDERPNTIAADFGTIGGGWGNTITEREATVAGGQQNDAAELAAVGGGGRNRAENGAVVGGGWFNRAEGVSATIGGGASNRASGYQATVAGGNTNDASGENATIGGGLNNTASGASATVPGGRENTADGDDSFAAGRGADANGQAGTFVWSDSGSTTFRATGPDQFLVDASGGVGIGTDAPITPLHVAGGDTGLEVEPGSHVALVENTENGIENAVLAVKTGYTSDPTSQNSFITFFRGDDIPIGVITGDGVGGIQVHSASADYAEYLPRVDPSERIEPGEIVGVVGGSVTKETTEADQVLVVSSQSIVAGNWPGKSPEDRGGHEICAFVGQVPVKVRGPVVEGDLVVPSGEHDGIGRAVAPEDWGPEAGPVVGRAWEGTNVDDVDEVTVAVGLETGEALLSVLDSQRDRFAELEAENEALRKRLDGLEDRLTGVENGLDARAATAD